MGARQRAEDVGRELLVWHDTDAGWDPAAQLGFQGAAVGRGL